MKYKLKILPSILFSVSGWYQQQTRSVWAGMISTSLTMYTKMCLQTDRINFVIVEKNCVCREFNFAKLTIKWLSLFYFFYKNCTFISNWNKTNMLSLSGLCGLRGFHVYKENWKPIIGDLLRCWNHERNNIYDHYAIKANKQLCGRLADSIISHLPGEITRATRFFLLRGGMVHLKGATSPFVYFEKIG